jgi:hypothetical protein
MTTSSQLRLGGSAAVVGAVAQFVATVQEPDWGGEPAKAVSVVSGSGLWIANRLVDLIGLLLTVLALTIVGQTLAGTGRLWARIATPFLVLMACLGAGAILGNAVMLDLADKYEHADASARQMYLVAFDATSRMTENLFFGAFLAMSIYVAALAPAILRGEVFWRRLGWACGLSAILLLGGNLLSILFEPAYFGLLAGYALFLVVVVVLGISMWPLSRTRR